MKLPHLYVPYAVNPECRRPGAVNFAVISLMRGGMNETTGRLRCVISGAGDAGSHAVEPGPFIAGANERGLADRAGPNFASAPRSFLVTRRVSSRHVLLATDAAASSAVVMSMRPRARFLTLSECANVAAMRREESLANNFSVCDYRLK